ncbi:hypothetical protein [Pseudomonas sp. 7-41]|uniref:hypothetical protein n=1 Tax=Pseudomonas sp. 7-41 TaxID=2898483 RepID=UPI001E5D4065|nr:hypothetical protein [Pseudomonas sp. 7-41]UHG95834.1 hypothetical protein LQ249_19270 [Pseudomonas sp. 7-41]
MKKLLERDGFVLAALPVLSFVVSLIFEMGYADAFGYDYFFIQIDLKAMVVALVCVVLLLMPLVVFLYAFIYLIQSDSRKVRVAALPMICPVIAMLFLYITGFQSTMMKWLLFISLGFLAFTLLRLLFKAKTKGWENALGEYADAEGVKDRSKSLGNKELRSQDYLYISLTIIVFISLVIFMIHGIGFGVAHWKTNYSTINHDGEEYALVASYGEKFIAAGVYDDRFNNKITIIPGDSEMLKDIKSARLDDFISSGLWFR